MNPMNHTEMKAERDKRNRAERTKYAEELLQRQREAAEKRRKEKEKTYTYDRWLKLVFISDGRICINNK